MQYTIYVANDRGLNENNNIFVICINLSLSLCVPVRRKRLKKSRISKSIRTSPISSNAEKRDRFHKRVQLCAALWVIFCLDLCVSLRFCCYCCSTSTVVANFAMSRHCKISNFTRKSRKRCI